MRTELNHLNYPFSNPFEVLEIFENKISRFFGSKYCVLVDSCTHGIELCLRSTFSDQKEIVIPLNTYISIPMTLEKLGIQYVFADRYWEKYYQINPTRIYDAATLWEKDSYIAGTMMVLSFQHKKHIKIGRGGAILLDDENLYNRLRKMRYDGRDLSKNHQDDQIDNIGYHYYMTPEDAALGVMLFDQHYEDVAKIWTSDNYVPLTNYKVFSKIKVIK